MKNRIWWMLVMALVAAPAAGVAQEQPDADEEEAAEQEAPFADFEELADGAEVEEGFFDLYRKDGKLWMAVPQDRLGEGFLLDMRVAQGIGAAGLYGGTTLDYFEMGLMAIEKHGERLYMVQRPHRFTAESDARARQAVDLTIGSSVVESGDVAAVRPDSALLVDVTGWFLSDLSGIGRSVGRAGSGGPEGGGGNAQFDRDRSFLEDAEAFPDNVLVRSRLTFRPGQPAGLASVPDGRYVSVSVSHTLARLPEAPMGRRYADDRVGNFWTVHKDFSAEDSTFFRRYVNRWRLEPGERVGDRWRPVEPITYYIDPNVPDEYRADFKAGVELWNRAFEAAGWEGAIRAMDLPEGADPDDIRYATLRWNTSDDPGYGAIGPSKVDPRTGETLDADILFEANMFMGYRNTWRNVVSPVTAAQAFEMALGLGAYVPSAAHVELPGFSAALQAQGSVAAALLAARDELRPGEPIPQDLLSQYTRWVVMHEVGHTLGLRHNFRSSASTPLERLHDTTFTEENGVFSSVMEYPTVNLNPDGPTGHYYNPGPGSYDRWAISFAYTQEQEDADALAREVARPEHLYGGESGGSDAMDPTINTYDLGADPLEWGTGRTAMLRDLIRELPAYVLADNVPYEDLASAYGQLMSEYARAVAPAVKYIGGQYLNRDHVGDGREPFVNVPKAEQDEALAMIVDRVLAPGALEVSPETLRLFAPSWWSHWGNDTGFGDRLDYPYHERVLDFQSSVLEQLLSPARLARIRDGEAKYGPDRVVTIPELMGSLTGAIWTELEGAGAAGDIGAVRRDLQRAHLDVLTGILVAPEEGTPADARSIARLELDRLKERIESASGGSQDAYTQAHLAESLARIDMALEAGLEVGMQPER